MTTAVFCRVTMRHKAGYVDDNAHNGHERGRQDVHEHVIGGKGAVQHAPGHIPAVFAENLDVAPGPALALVEALLEPGRLLVIEHPACFTVTYLAVVHHIVHRELNVLG